MDTKAYIISKAIELLETSFNIYEASKVFEVDYKNMCAYVRGRKEMPLKLAFAILDYMDAKLVIFRSNKTL